jgi:hypothetical protein
MNTVSSERRANIDRWVFRIAGAMVLVSVLLSQLHSAHWLWLTAFGGSTGS